MVYQYYGKQQKQFNCYKRRLTVTESERSFLKYSCQKYATCIQKIWKILKSKNELKSPIHALNIKLWEIDQEINTRNFTLNQRICPSGNVPRNSPRSKKTEFLPR